MSWTDQQIADLLEQCGGDVYAVVEHMCDWEYAREMMSDEMELELAWNEYTQRAERVKSTPVRRALVTLTWERDDPAAYLPSNYEVESVEPHPDRPDSWRQALIRGRDSHGWTLDDYVLPRLASGGMPGREINEEEINA